MKLSIGSSGYSYREWQGGFYPAGTRNEQMLGHYARELSAVEINNTFYRMPRTSTLEQWAGQVPEDFAFALKASRRITHDRRLSGVDDLLDYLTRTIGCLGDRLGPLLFQLPPNFARDLERLKGLLALLPRRQRVALEFRHESWFDEPVFETLRAHNAALCFGDGEGPEGEVPEGEVLATADWGYIRLRRGSHDGDALRRWRDRVAEQPWKHAFIFFKHDEGGPGPRAALAFRELVLAGPD